MTQIITLTMNPALDKSASVPNVLPDKKLRCGPPRFEPGGGGVNVSRAIQRLGGFSYAYFTAGGSVGHMVAELIKQEGIETHLMPIEENTRVSMTISEESSGQQYRFSMPGPELSKREWQSCLSNIKDAISESEPICFVASGSLPRNVPSDFYRQLAKWIRKTNHYLIIDSYGDPLRLAIKEGVYLLKANMRELSCLAGFEIENETQQEKAASKIIHDGQAQIVVVSLGAAGALFVSQDGAERIPAPTVKIRSKIGAGDSMVAGTVFAIVQGKTVRDSICYGIAAGSAAVMTPGTELCHRTDTERLYKELRRKVDQHDMPA